MTLTENGNSLFDLEDNFNMYISISKFAKNSLPKDIIQHIIFNQQLSYSYAIQYQGLALV